MIDYQQQARSFLRENRITLEIARGKGQVCPPWSKKGDCDHMHGDRYIISLYDIHGQDLHFPFWGSLHDKGNGKKPSEYDVLACLSSDSTCSTDPDEVYEELGDIKPSQAKAIADMARKLQDFFSPKALDALREIQ